MGGAISDLRLEDGGDCCIRCEGGTWSLTRLRLRCSHGAALLASHGSRVTLNDCILGGEGEDEMGKHVMLSAYGSVQEQGLSKRACYALVLRNEAVCHLTGCQLRECSEAALLVAHRARALLARCRIYHCHATFISGVGRGRALELSSCSIELATADKLWADADRPHTVVWGDHNLVEWPDAEETSEDDAARWGDAGIVPPQPRVGEAGDDADSDDSLDEQTFAVSLCTWAEPARPTMPPPQPPAPIRLPLQAGGLLCI